MKKFIAIILTLLLIFSLFACGKKDETPKVDYETFEDYTGTIYNTDNYTSTDTANLEGNYHLAKNIQDGVILHAWNWSYNEIKNNLETIAQAGFSTIQTSPVQQPKEYNASLTDVAGRWWKLYQPLSFSIAKESWLGTKDELTSLCTEAKKYGIKIIVDIVVNHLAGGSATSLNENVQTYEKEVYDNNLIHTEINGLDSIGSEVARPIGEYPDLQTESPYIQSRVISLLEECLDCGVSGFRFDAAKHIANSTDGKYANNFWENVLGTASTYANEHYQFTPYYYGEILNGLAGGRNMETYTALMSVTDDTTSERIFTQSSSKTENWGELLEAEMSQYYKSDDPSKIVLWVESHDTYTSNNENGGNNPALVKINKTWSIIANRQGATALYFARPNYQDNKYMSQMGEIGNTDFLEPAVCQTNKFHNLFIGAEEIRTYQSGCLVLERYREEDNKRGLIITNVSGKNDAFVSGIETNLAEGLYIDQVTGNRFLVENGKLRGKLDGGVAVLYQTAHTKNPIMSLLFYSVSSTKFYTNQKIDVEITLSTQNVDSMTYTIDGGSSKEVKDNKINVDKNCIIVVTAKKGEHQTSKTIVIDNIDNSIKKKNGYVAFAGASEEFLNNYSIYAWVWMPGHYVDVVIENGIIYVPYEEKDTGILLVTFAKGQKYKKVNEWDNTFIAQTADYYFDPDVCYDSHLR